MFNVAVLRFGLLSVDCLLVGFALVIRYCFDYLFNFVFGFIVVLFVFVWFCLFLLACGWDLFGFNWCVTLGV